MGNRVRNLSLAISLLSVTLYAQPPEEAETLEVQKMSQEEKRLFLPQGSASDSPDDRGLQAIEIPALTPVDNYQTTSGPRANVPVAEVLEVPKDASAEKPDLEAKLTPSIELRPVGGDYLESQQWTYFAVHPALGFKKTFLTATGKKVDFNIGYDFTWREYYNKTLLTRDFTNGGSLGLSGALNERLSLSVNAGVEHFLITGSASGAETYFLATGGTSLDMKVNDTLSFSFGPSVDYLDLAASYVNLIDVDGGSGTPAGVADFTGGLFSGATAGDDSYDDFGLLNGETSIKWLDYYVNLGGKLKASKDITLALNYAYNFYRVTNVSNFNLTGHFITPSYSHKLPWGGNLGLKYQARLRRWESATVGTAGEPKRQLRNRFFLTYGQEVFENVTMNLFYRYEISGSNADNYAVFTPAHQFYLGTTYSF